MDIRFLKTSVTRSAIVASSFELSILWSLLDEHHFCTIYCISLNVRAVDEFLKIFKPNNVVIHITANLKESMESMRGYTVRAETGATIKTTHVPLVLLRRLMVWTSHEELLCV
jgi:hypothetical protein